jgi:hypothetical protein
MPNPEDAVAGEVTKFPFLLLLSSVFFKGFTFILFNGPLLELMLKGDRPTSFRMLLLAVLDRWESLFQAGNPLTALPAVILLSIVVGMLIEPVEKSYSTLLAWALTSLARWCRLRSRRTLPARRFFSSRDMGSSERYVRLLGWFFTHREQREHWEWELFLSYLHWGTATNVLVFAALSLVLLGGRLSGLFVLALGLPVAFFFTVAVFSSSAMAQVHDLYLDRATAAQDRELRRAESSNKSAGGDA